MCGHHCAVHRFCVAINYKEDVKGNETNCQLTNTTNHTFNEQARKEDKIWTFRKVKADRSFLVSSSIGLTSRIPPIKTPFSNSKFLVKCRHNYNIVAKCKLLIIFTLNFTSNIEERTETVLLGEGGGDIPLQCSAHIYEGRL